MIKGDDKEGNGNGSVRIDNAEAQNRNQAQLPEQPGAERRNSGKLDEPDFMKYIRGVNMNFDDKAYL